MGILWLVDGVLSQEPKLSSSFESQQLRSREERLESEARKTRVSPLASDTAPPPVNPQDQTLLSSESRDFLVPPIPPPNSEVVAQPRANLEHRLGTASKDLSSVNPIAPTSPVEQQQGESRGIPSTVGELMSPDPVTGSADMSTSEALALLEDSGYHHLPVVDQEQRLIGLVSDRDLIGRGRVLGERMVKQVLTATPGTGLQEATQALVSQKFHSLVVIDDEHHPVGMITSFDLLRFLTKHPALKLWHR